MRPSTALWCNLDRLSLCAVCQGAAQLVLGQWRRLLQDVARLTTSPPRPPEALDPRVAKVEAKVWDEQVGR